MGRIAIAGLAQCRFTEVVAWRQGEPCVNDYAAGMLDAYSFTVSNFDSISLFNCKGYLDRRFLRDSTDQ